MRIVHVVASLAEVRGGPPRSVINLCEILSELGCKIDIVTLDDSAQLGSAVPHNPNLVTVHRVSCKYSKHIKNFHSSEFRETLINISKDADVIHSHGLWLPVNHDASLIAKRLPLPHIISVRGNLHEAALQSSYWKKKIARFWYVNSNIQGARCLHATSDSEVKFIRHHGFNNPIAKLPVGVKIQNVDATKIARHYETRWPELKSKRVLLYLGRINAHKGVLNLAEAWAKVGPLFPEWHLVMAGPDENGCTLEARNILEANGTLDSFSFTGAVTGDDKLSLMASCGLLVLPSRSENFGNVVAEALAIGRPVLTTITTPWDDIDTYQCGWRIGVGTNPIVDKLKDVLNLPAEALNQIGANGVNLIKSNYNSIDIGKQMIEVYEWLINENNQPSCILNSFEDLF